MSHISYVIIHYAFQERHHKFQFLIVLIIEPTFNRDAIVWLVVEVFLDVINNDNFTKVPA